MWRYVFSDGNSHICDFLEEGRNKRERDRRLVEIEEDSINCQKIFTEEKELNGGNTFFWLEGEKDKVDELLRTELLSDFQLPRSEEFSENKGIDGLQEVCSKSHREKNRIEIFCKN